MIPLMRMNGTALNIDQLPKWGRYVSPTPDPEYSRISRDTHATRY